MTHTIVSCLIRQVTSPDHNALDSHVRACVRVRACSSARARVSCLIRQVARIYIYSVVFRAARKPPDITQCTHIVAAVAAAAATGPRLANALQRRAASRGSVLNPFHQCALSLQLFVPWPWPVHQITNNFDTTYIWGVE